MPLKLFLWVHAIAAFSFFSITGLSVQPHNTDILLRYAIIPCPANEGFIIHKNAEAVISPSLMITIQDGSSCLIKQPLQGVFGKKIRIHVPKKGNIYTVSLYDASQPHIPVHAAALITIVPHKKESDPSTTIILNRPLLFKNCLVSGTICVALCATSCAAFYRTLISSCLSRAKTQPSHNPNIIVPPVPVVLPPPTPLYSRLDNINADLYKTYSCPELKHIKLHVIGGDIAKIRDVDSIVNPAHRNLISGVPQACVELFIKRLTKTVKRSCAMILNCCALAWNR